MSEETSQKDHEKEVAIAQLCDTVGDHLRKMGVVCCLVAVNSDGQVYKTSVVADEPIVMALLATEVEITRAAIISRMIEDRVQRHDDEPAEPAEPVDSPIITS